MSDLEVAISVTTYQKPWHLRRTLASIAGQQGIDGKFEVVVTDDGSTDETAEIVEQFRRNVDFPVRFTTHPHAAFQVSKCRNAGARATAAPYLLYVDGDCVLPPNHVAIHLVHRKAGYAVLGDCYRVEREVSETLTEEAAHRGDFLDWNVNGERERHAVQHRKAQFYSFLGYKYKPKLVGNNFAVWRSDFERVNGFDENFCGWGQEDDDLGLRLRQAGVRLKSILRWTRSYHLWHPRDPSTTVCWRDGVNVPYFLRRGRLTRCRNGIVKRAIGDLVIEIVGEGDAADRTRDMLTACGTRVGNGTPSRPNASGHAEVEILAHPSPGRFSGRAEFNLLLRLDESPPNRRLLEQANAVVSISPIAGLNGKPQFPLNRLSEALDAVA
jgi:glycosyltransferase involved in cell wall biosynthesis